MKITEIIIHCSDTKDNGVLSDFEAIRKYHIENNGWKDIGYQFVCEYVKGVMVARVGRAEGTVGSHCLGHNDKSVGICHVGAWDKVAPRDADILFVAKLCAQICKRHKLTEKNIYPHSDFSAKTCPGLKYPMDKLRNMVKILLSK